MAQTQKCRIVFMGTPEFAAASLKRLAAWPRGEIVAVYTQPDRPAGRGHKLSGSPVKKLALQLGLPVLQPASLKGAEAQAELAAFKPDLLAVAAYGLILPDAVLAMPRLDSINVHASLLPGLRGAAPIQRAVIDGWQPGARAGISIMRILSKLDAGPVFATDDIAIDEHTAGTLHDALAGLGAELLVRVFDDIIDGKAKAVDQDDALATYAPKISKEDGFIDWSLPAAQVHARVRGVTPWPGARTVLETTAADGVQRPPLSLIFAPGRVGEATDGAAPGSVHTGPDGLSIACADRWYILSTARPQGKKDMSARDLLNGILRGLPKGICGVARAPAAGD